MPRITPFEILPSSAEIMQRPVAPVPSDMLGTPELQHLVDRMMVTMIEAGGVGLAGPQVGVGLSVVVAEPNWKAPRLKQYKTALINASIVPDIDPRSGEALPTHWVWNNEGCLSAPDYFAQIARPDRLRVQSLDLQGNPHRRTYKQYGAQVTGHELDHTSGVQMMGVPKKRRRFEAQRPKQISMDDFIDMYYGDPKGTSERYPFTDDDRAEALGKRQTQELLIAEHVDLSKVVAIA